MRCCISARTVAQLSKGFTYCSANRYGTYLWLMDILTYLHQPVDHSTKWTPDMQAVISSCTLTSWANNSCVATAVSCVQVRSVIKHTTLSSPHMQAVVVTVSFALQVIIGSLRATLRYR